MKNWLIFGSIFIVSLSVAIFVLVLWNADAPFNDKEAKGKELALESKTLAVVSDAYTYNSNKPYITVFGMDEYGEKKAVFVPNNFDKKAIQEVFLKDGITKEEAIAILRNEANVKEILHAKLGYEDAGAVWEITYIDETDKLNYVYIMFKNGEWLKRILNL